MRAFNRRVLLRLIERDGPISRADLARRAGLTMPSVSEIVDELLACGLVAWGGEGRSTGGRRPALLRFNPSRGSVLAADLASTRAIVGLFLLDGTLVSETSFVLPANARGDDVVDRLASCARELLAASPPDCPPVLAMGVAAPGVTDPETGEVSLAPAVGWAGTPVRHMLEQRLGVAVVVDNDVNAAALAEWRFGQGAHYHSFVFVSIGTGVGMGVLLGGLIHRGRLHQAGEIGYMVVEPVESAKAGRDTRQFGNLEARLSLPALARDYLAFWSGSASARPSDPEEDPEPVLSRLFEDFAAGDRMAVAFLRERAGLLARALLNVYLVLAPDAIFLGGPVSPYVPLLQPIVEAELEQISPFRPLLVASALRRAGLVGACALASDLAKENLMRPGGAQGAWRGGGLRWPGLAAAANERWLPSARQSGRSGPWSPS